MAETKGKQAPRAKSKVKVETGPIEAETVVEIEGFTSEEVSRLLQARRRIAAGEYTDVTPEHRKLLFVQWLIDHEHLKS
jgi:hypothetical protein